MRFLLACLAAAAACTPASAAWNVAQSKHFVIYADDNPKHLYDFATRLERFDQAVRYATRMDDPQIGDGNRLTLFVLPTEKDVRSIMGDKTGFFSGFYTGRIAGSLAYVPKQPDNPDALDQDAIFFHEYTHHLMNQDLDRPYPQWYSEGFAEFFSSPRFDRDGSVWLGRVVQGRAYGLFEGPQLPLETLFEGMQPGMTNAQRDVFYGRAWLLTHYLLLDPHRRGQLDAYLAAMSKGGSATEAARQAFSDLKQLEKELDAYREKRLMQFQIPAADIHLQPIVVTPLTAGASQVIMTRARIKYDVKSEAETLAAQVRAVESQFPGDELVESTLAEAELDAGHPQAAEAAADRAIKANSRDTEAMVMKGRAIADRADQLEGSGRHMLFDQARRALIAANQLDTEDPEPLYEFFRTFVREGVRPTENALAALHYASDLAPQDLGVRMSSAIAFINEGKPKEARSALTVVAYSPHVAEMGDIARRMIADIDAGNPRAALFEGRSAPRQASSKH